MIGGATDTTSGGGLRGHGRRTRGYARTVAQKREARRARRARGVATIIVGGGGGGRRRRRRDRGDGEEEDDDDGEVLDDDVENASGEETRVDDEDGDDDDDDYYEAGNDVVDSRLDDRDVVDGDLLLRGDTATNDNVVHDENAADEDESSSRGDESFDTSLDERKTRASRSSCKKKRKVIRDDDDDDDNDGSSREEDGHVESAISDRGGTAEITAKRGASDRDDSPTRDASAKDERNDGDSGRYGPDKRRSGRTRHTAKTTGRDRMSTDDDSEREFVVDSIMAPVDRRHVSASASDKKGRRCKKIRRTEKIGEVEEHGRYFPSSLGNDGVAMHYNIVVAWILSNDDSFRHWLPIPSCHP